MLLNFFTLVGEIPWFSNKTQVDSREKPKIVQVHFKRSHANHFGAGKYLQDQRILDLPGSTVGKW